jgi:S1-C subfamily serine protease
MLRWLVAVALGLVGAATFAQSSDKPAAPSNELITPVLGEGVRDLLARVRPAVVQIKGFFGANTAQAFHGTGFAVAPDGVLMTNYHVVAQQVLYPDKYRLEYRTSDGAIGKIMVLAIDVRHDLAVVRAEGFAPAPLRIDPAVPTKGSRAYAVGFPLDVGLTITEGISNGRVEDSFDARVHYSGAINGGMSGGPALNAAGEVIGVNVAGYRFEQLVSFLVPAAHLRPLIDRAIAKPASVAEMKQEVGEQLRAHGGALLDALRGPLPTQVTAGYALPAKLAPFIDCRAAGDPAPDAPVNQIVIRCAAKAGLYVEQGRFTGDLRFEHYVLATDKLDAWRFARRLTNLSRASGAFGGPKYVGPFACGANVVSLRGFDANLMVCTRSHRKVDGLYDITIRVTSLNEAKRGFASHLDMHGVQFDAGMGFVRRYVEAMQWTP